MKKALSACLICMLLCSGCTYDGKSPNAKAVNGETDCTLSDESVYNALSNKMIAWGLKKNKNAPPSVPESITKVVEDNGGVYISDREKCLYLTFDEGYENGYTGKILDTLKEKNVPAAFFITGDYLKSEADLVGRMVSEGHTVGNHTKNHPSMPSCKSIQKLSDEITLLDDEFFSLTGTHMKYIRPPKGEFSERTLAVSRDLGYISVLWSFAYEDWKRDEVRGREYAFEHVTEYLHDGAIILLHAVSADNADALGDIIDYAVSEGYRFESLDNL